jgi:acylphosphatase
VRRVRIVVRGRVQGVFFRASLSELARSLGLDGWVSNRPDGAVAAVIQGDDSRVERAIAWCRHGPELARVDSVEVSDEPGERGDRGFSVS